MSDAIKVTSLNAGGWTEVVLDETSDATGCEQTVLQKAHGSIHIGHRFMRPGSGQWEWNQERGVNLDREGVARLREGLL